MNRFFPQKIWNIQIEHSLRLVDIQEWFKFRDKFSSRVSVFRSSMWLYMFGRVKPVGNCDESSNFNIIEKRKKILLLGFQRMNSEWGPR